MTNDYTSQEVWFCPKCGFRNVGGRNCIQCFADNPLLQNKEASPPETVHNMSASNLNIKLDCNACKTQGAMTATKIARFSTIVRVIGGILLIPSFLGFAFACLMLFSTIMATSNMPTTHSEAGQAGAAIGAAIGFGFSVFVGVLSLVGGLLGWLLLLNRNVYKCLRCGFVMDRA